MNDALHTSVLLREVVEGLEPKSGGVYVDATCGLGGHAEAILEACAPDGRLLGIDRDPRAIELAGERLARFGDRFTAVEGSFSDIGKHARATNHFPANGVVADLGVSSMQIDEPERGFTFRAGGPLDMRMGPSVGETLGQLLDRLDADALADILREYGEVTRPKRVAERILEAKQQGEINSTDDLAKLVERAVGGRERRRSIHPATKVFQALRIAVNRELDELDAFLAALPEALAPGGRVCVISFHSLEDRRVKNAFRDPKPEPVPRGLPIEPEKKRGPFQALTKRPVVASQEEIDRNPRARSAKLRIAERRTTEGAGP